MNRESTKRLTRLGLLAAISLLLMYFVHFPIFPSAPFLEYDMGDVGILIGTFMYGPLWGLLITAVVCLLQWLLVSPASGWIGAMMHFFATGSFVIVAGLIYRRMHTRKGAAIALACGTITMVLAMIPLNLIFTVGFQGAPRDLVVSMLPTVIIPFNLIKAGANALITFLVYKLVAKALRLERSTVESPAE
ncbi:ECF transporter S component [Christensenellaceae bacterium OttesenSCG-928-L17]|nr:ECF transporter S component [Christensenellaceae bacterium OttesenSCG-928-L17]